MRFTLLPVPVLLALLPLQAGAQSAADSTEIMRAMESWEEAWIAKDPQLAARDYADDADWTNAFGHRRIGRRQLEAFLDTVFALPFVMAGTTEYVDHDLSFLTPDVALLRSRAERRGQEDPTGETLGLREINHLRVFQKRDGSWIIVSHLIADRREPRAAAPPTDTLIALAREWTATWNEKDPERMRRLHSEELSDMLYGIGDGFGTVEALLENIREENFWGLSWSIQMLEPHVRLLGADAALVSFRLRGEETDGRGATRPYASAVSLVFQRRAGEWKIVHVHESSGPPPGR